MYCILERVLMVMVSHIETLIIVLEVTFLLVVRRFGYIMWPEHKKRRERETIFDHDISARSPTCNNWASRTDHLSLLVKPDTVSSAQPVPPPAKHQGNWQLQNWGNIKCIFHEMYCTYLYHSSVTSLVSSFQQYNLLLSWVSNTETKLSRCCAIHSNIVALSSYSDISQYLK